MNNVLAFPGGPCVIDLFPAEDSGKTTRVPPAVVSALHELDEAERDAVDLLRSLARNAKCPKADAAAARLDRAFGAFEFLITQHLGRGQAR